MIWIIIVSESTKWGVCLNFDFDTFFLLMLVKGKVKGQTKFIVNSMHPFPVKERKDISFSKHPIGDVIVYEEWWSFL